MQLSVIVPVFNERENLAPLHARLAQVLGSLGATFEVLYVDDGSTDGSAERLRELAGKDARFQVIHLRRNFGQTAAVMAGIESARGEVLVLIDADLQNDPADIPRLLSKLEEGCDVCSGWRTQRRDALLTRRLPSLLANRLVSFISGVRLHDFGCTLKAYRRSALDGIKLYGEMHRFIPIYASWLGAKVTEVPVAHHPRRHGRSKYGIGRTFKVLLDLIVVAFLAGYTQKPIYVFGGFGLLSLLASLVSFAAMIYFKYWGGKSFIETPLPLLVVLFCLIGVMSILMGLIAELLMRTYYESQHKPVYLVRERFNPGDSHPCAASPDLPEADAGSTSTP